MGTIKISDGIVEKTALQEVEVTKPQVLAKLEDSMLNYLRRHQKGMPYGPSVKIRVTVDEARGLPAISTDVYGDILITRHRPRKKFVDELRKAGVQLYVIEDFVSEHSGAVNQLVQLENIAIAEELQLRDVTPIPIAYKGKNIPYGAVIGTPEPDRIHRYYGFTLDDLDARIHRTLRSHEDCVEECFDSKVKSKTGDFSIHHSYSYGGSIEYSDSDQDRIRELQVKTRNKKIEKVAVASCLGFKPEFIEQVHKAGAQVYISSGLNADAVKLADELGITIYGVTDYSTHVPFMKKLAKAIGGEFMPRSFLW